MRAFITNWLSIKFSIVISDQKRKKQNWSKREITKKRSYLLPAHDSYHPGANCLQLVLKVARLGDVHVEDLDEGVGVPQ